MPDSCFDESSDDEIIVKNRSSFTLTEIQINIPTWKKNNAILFYQHWIQSSVDGIYNFNKKAKLFRQKQGYKIHTRDLYLQYLAWIQSNNTNNLEAFGINEFTRHLNLFHKAISFQPSKQLKISGINTSGFLFKLSSTEIKEHIQNLSAWFISPDHID